MSLKGKRIRSINWDEEEKDITEKTFQLDVVVCENVQIGEQVAGSPSVITVVEDHIPAASQEIKELAPTLSQELTASMILQDSAEATQIKTNMEAIAPKNIFIKKIKNASKSPSSAKSRNYIQKMVSYSKTMKEQEHLKRLEILEVELNMQKEKLKNVLLEREILEIRKAKESKLILLNKKCLVTIYFLFQLNAPYSLFTVIVTAHII